MTKPSLRKRAKPTTKKVSPAARQMQGAPIVAAPRREAVTVSGEDARFTEVLALIDAARNRAYQAVNSELVSLYWQLGELISRKVASAEWGDGVVDELAATLARRFPGLRGFTRPN